jgi:NADH-quinone oxidoreductase subunit C
VTVETPGGEPARGKPDRQDQPESRPSTDHPADQVRPDSHVAQEAAPTTREAQDAARVDPPTEVATTEAEPEVVDLRRGAFGAHDTGDTSGYGGLRRPVVMPAPAERPLDGWWEGLAQVLARVLPEDGTTFEAAIEKIVADRGELTLYVRREYLLPLARRLRDEPELRFEICSGVSGVHYPNDVGRELHAVYHLLSITHGARRVRLEVVCPDADPHIPSVVSVWPGNDWHERETWDMFGIRFDGHPSLTRILMPDDWPGHPQRKDYPLGGIPVQYKGADITPPDERRSYS